MSGIKHIVLKEGAPIRVPAGVFHAEPLLVEVGTPPAIIRPSSRKNAEPEHHFSVELAAGAKLHLAAFVLATGGETGLSLTVDFTGEDAEFHLHALYIASGPVPEAGAKSGRADINVRVNHLAPDCRSRQLVKGIVTGGATGSFTGFIHVASGASGTDASQQNRNLQLSDTANVFTLPQLEIYADDVKCSHGASVGRLDREAIYYMRQRGIPEAEARRMQLQGFMDEIIDRCPSEHFHKMITARAYEMTANF